MKPELRGRLGFIWDIVYLSTSMLAADAMLGSPFRESPTEWWRLLVGVFFIASGFYYTKHLFIPEKSDDES